MKRLAAALLTVLVSLAAEARGGADATGSTDQPRRNVRLGLSVGQALVTPPLCSDCDSFWGRALTFVVDVGWTLRPNLVLSLEEQGAVIHFADGTNASIGGVQLSLRHFWQPRAFWLGGAGVGFRDVAEDENPRYGVRLWSQTGALLTLGAGWEPGRRGAWSYDLQVRATAVVAGGVFPGLLLLLGGSWN